MLLSGQTSEIIKLVAQKGAYLVSAGSSSHLGIFTEKKLLCFFHFNVSV